MRLRPYQIDGATWLASKTAALLGDDPGLGKTATTLLALVKVDAERVVVVCPTAVLHNWRREVYKWAPHLTVQVITRGSQTVDENVNVVVLSHGMLLGEPMFRQLRGFAWNVCVVDESHFFRGRDAKRTLRLYGQPDARELGLAACAKRIWLLSATPMPNDPSELWTMAAGAFGFPESFFKFRSRYCETDYTPYGDNVKVVGAKNSDELRKRLADRVLRRKKKEVAQDLPALRFETLKLDNEVSPATIDAVEAELDPALLERIRGLDPEQAFEEISGDKAFAAYRRIVGLAKADEVADLLEVELDSGLEQVVVMGHHSDVLSRLEERLGKFGVSKVTGATPDLERHRAVDDFQAGRSRVFIGNIIAAGTGITLTAASELVFVEMSFVPGENSQAAQRIHRLGQADACRCRFAMLHGTLDEALVGVLLRKTQMIAEVIE